MLVADHARAVVYHAIAEARCRNKAAVDTGDLLMGLLVSRDVVTRAVWREFGVGAESLRDVLAAEAARGATPAATPSVAPACRGMGIRADAITRRPTAFSVEARQVLVRAFAHARAHRSRRLGPAHLLLAITAQDDCDRARVLLSALDVDVIALARALRRRLSGLRAAGGGHACGTARSSPGPSDGLWPPSDRSGSR